MGAAIFHHFEMPYELHIRNETMHRVHALKQSIIDELWTLSHSNRITIDEFSDYAQHRYALCVCVRSLFCVCDLLRFRITNASQVYYWFRMDLVIKDVFLDYTKNYMTPDDIINGTGPVKWSWGSSIFFSWTSITTIGSFLSFGVPKYRFIHFEVTVILYRVRCMVVSLCSSTH